MDEKEIISTAMSLLGKRRSDKKTEAARANAAKARPNRKPKPLEEIPCSCGGEGLDHKAGCPRGRAIRYRIKKGLEVVFTKEVVGN